MAPAPTTQGHRGQKVVYTFREEMTLKAVEAIIMALDGQAASTAKRTYHVHPHTGDMWHYAFPGEDGMERRAPLPKCARQGNEVSAVAKVVEEWVRETGGAEQGTWTVGDIRRHRYRRGEWMTWEDTKVIFPVATKGPAAAQSRGQAVHILLLDDRVGDRGTVEVSVPHGQGARYQYNVLVTRSRGGPATGRCGDTHKQAGRQSTALTGASITPVSCDKAFQDPCHSETRKQKYVQQHIRICTHGVKTGLG